MNNRLPENGAARVASQPNRPTSPAFRGGTLVVKDTGISARERCKRMKCGHFVHFVNDGNVRRSPERSQVRAPGQGAVFYSMPPDDQPDLDWFNRPRKVSNPDPSWFGQSQTWQALEIHLDDGRILVREST